MKTLTILLTVVCCINAYAQDSTYIIEGQTVDARGAVIADVYVINPRTMEKDITRANGVFKLAVSAGDSLIFSHISYFRVSVNVHQLLKNPVVTLESEDQQIPEVVVSPEQKSDLKRAKQNLEFLDDYKPLKYNKIQPESDPTTTIMTEHNRLMRTEAGSVSLLPILGVPINAIDKAVQKRKRRKMYRTDYYSTRKVKKPPIQTESETEQDSTNVPAPHQNVR
ncbi:hypothetical protein [uncultured Draconibacterium sp.]|uniref:hypothetical protein n=1 Tax=uncultured Draconibacterium sp. TaxID=1573823 RepID=UPI002AA758B4|nr:hypothetical protein [uncultured Draconibacterium sp.]